MEKAGFVCGHCVVSGRGLACGVIINRALRKWNRLPQKIDFAKLEV